MNLDECSEQRALASLSTPKFFQESNIDIVKTWRRPSLELSMIHATLSDVLVHLPKGNHEKDFIPMSVTELSHHILERLGKSTNIDLDAFIRLEDILHEKDNTTLLKVKDDRQIVERTPKFSCQLLNLAIVGKLCSIQVKHDPGLDFEVFSTNAPWLQPSRDGLSGIIPARSRLDGMEIKITGINRRALPGTKAFRETTVRTSIYLAATAPKQTPKSSGRSVRFKSPALPMSFEENAHRFSSLPDSRGNSPGPIGKMHTESPGVLSLWIRGERRSPNVRRRTMLDEIFLDQSHASDTSCPMQNDSDHESTSSDVETLLRKLSSDAACGTQLLDESKESPATDLPNTCSMFDVVQNNFRADHREKQRTSPRRSETFFSSRRGSVCELFADGTSDASTSRALLTELERQRFEQKLWSLHVESSIKKGESEAAAPLHNEKAIKKGEQDRMHPRTSGAVAIDANVAQNIREAAAEANVQGLDGNTDKRDIREIRMATFDSAFRSKAVVAGSSDFDDVFMSSGSGSMF